MGGVKTSLDSRVEGFKNLFAIGEIACSGVHGANRLASNSLLEGLVFSQIAIETAKKNNFKINKNDYTFKIKTYIRNKGIDKDIKNQLRKIMWENAAIIREKKNLEKSLSKINDFLKEDVGRLLYLRLLTAKSILESANERQCSLGAHYIKEN